MQTDTLWHRESHRHTGQPGLSPSSLSLTKLRGGSPWAALVFLIISLSGSFLLPTGNVLLVFIWMLVAFCGGSFYFKWLPDSYDISNEERPYWVQDVGHITVSCHCHLSCSAYHTSTIILILIILQPSSFIPHPLQMAESSETFRVKGLGFRVQR